MKNAFAYSNLEAIGFCKVWKSTSRLLCSVIHHSQHQVCILFFLAKFHYNCVLMPCFRTNDNVTLIKIMQTKLKSKKCVNCKEMTRIQWMLGV